MKRILNHSKAQNTPTNTSPPSTGVGSFVKQNIWFTVNTLGFFKYISPSLLEYLEGMENQFFESVLFEKSGKNELPSPVEFLTEMINTERESVFVEEVLKSDPQETSGAYWNIVAEGCILKFTLSETPPTAEVGERRVS
jgi:hypothetical protein